MPTWVSFTGATTAAATGYLQTPGDPANLSDAIADITPPVTDEWAVVKATENAIIHAIFARLDAEGVTPLVGGPYMPVPVAAVTGNFASFDASDLVIDSGYKPSDFALAGHAHAGTYAPLAHAHDWGDITSGKPTTLAGYGITDAQPIDTDLTALAALTGTGIAVRTGAGTWTTRLLQSSDGSVNITNQAGIGGNPDIELDMAHANTWTGLQTFTRAAGSAPFAVWTAYAAGATVVNLSADRLDGYHASAFATASHTHVDEDGFFTLDGGDWDAADVCIGRVDGGTWDTPAEWS